MTTARSDEFRQPGGGTDGQPVLDLRILTDLLVMTGPEVAPEFLCALRSDLDAVATGLQAQLLAVPAPDWAELRAQSHVLVGLAGSTGAPRLHARARQLNALAHAQDATTLQDVLDECLSLIRRFDAELIRVAANGSTE